MRNRIIRVRCTETEAAKMHDLAKGRGLSLSDMVRRAALGVRMPARSLDGADAALIVRLIGELSRQGSNLNQLVRRAHVGKLAGHDEDLTRTLEGINVLRERLRRVIR